MIWMLSYIIVAYLIGSLSSALIVCKLMHLPDPRTQGSGNAGATNVLRMGNKNAAVLVLLGDVIKGLVVVILANIVNADAITLSLVAFAVVLGHIFPVFFGFHGGKGVATAFGVLIGFSIPVAVCVALTWLVFAALFRYASVASIMAALSAIFFGVFFAQHHIFAIMLIAFTIVIMHYKNVLRLFKGQENKIHF